MSNNKSFRRVKKLSLTTVVVATAVGAIGLFPCSPVGATNVWGTAIEVPGSSVLNTGHSAIVDSIACSSAGNCSAGGYYWIRPAGEQGFVVDEINGKWKNAIEVPGVSALETGTDGGSSLNALSCASPGNCSAGGTYNYGSVQGQAFVVDEVNGVWGNAIEVPGSAALNTYGLATVNAISCPSAGNCSAGGSYGFARKGNAAFVVDEVNGVWGNAVVPSNAPVFDTYGLDPVNAISCPSAGNCSASGVAYIGAQRSDTTTANQIYVVSEVNSVWGTAIEAPRSAVVNRGGTATVNSISCPSAGNCSVVGALESDPHKNINIRGVFQAFVADEVNGVWRNVTEIPGSVTLNKGGEAALNSVYCTSTGNCSAGGYLQVSSSKRQAFVTREVNGVWGRATVVPGSTALNTGGDAMVNVISCASSGNCSAGGYYYATTMNREAFVVSEVHGIWGGAHEVPGTASLNTNWAEVDAIACSRSDYCSAGGKYSIMGGGYQAFVASKR